MKLFPQTRVHPPPPTEYGWFCDIEMDGPITTIEARHDPETHQYYIHTRVIQPKAVAIDVDLTGVPIALAEPVSYTCESYPIDIHVNIQNENNRQVSRLSTALERYNNDEPSFRCPGQRFAMCAIVNLALAIVCIVCYANRSVS